jgi:hypothetical protein
VTAEVRDGETVLLPAVERALEQAREELDDLERRASRASIPREWRQ